MTDRTPYCHKIRYGITGAPILAGDEMDGTHAPGVGLDPTLIELVYSASRDGKPASVSASVTGQWTRFGKREPFDDQMTTHFKNGPDGWPAWLAEEARLHDPTVSSPLPDQTLRDRIAGVLAKADGWTWTPDFDRTLSPVWQGYLKRADAVLAVLPPADRAAVLLEAAERLRALAEHAQHGVWVGMRAAADELRRLAAEAQQQPDTETRLAAATCSAQYHGTEEVRHCIRAAQHTGKAHTDANGFHWSDTVAVYPLADGTFRTGVNVRAALAAALAVAGPRPTADDRQDGAVAPTATLHAVPLPGSNGISSCCGRPPCEFVGERVTRDPDKVTCTGPAVPVQSAADDTREDCECGGSIPHPDCPVHAPKEA